MKARHMNGCKQGRSLLVAYVDGGLTAEQRISFEQHVLDCDLCDEAHRFHLSIEELLHVQAGPEPDGSFEDRIVDRVMESVSRLAAEPLPGPGRAPSAKRQRDRRTRVFVLLATAALLLLLARSVNTPSSVGAGDPGVPGSPTASAEIDQIIPERLTAARLTLHDALRSAQRAPDFRAEFERLTHSLVQADWPVEEMVIATIGHADPELAVCALRGVAELDYRSALPAVERAAFRSPTARAALETMGSLGDERSLPRLERSLARPELATAAATGLTRNGTAAAARVLGRAVEDEDQRPAALSALVSMGTAGAGELLRLRQAGSVPAARELQARNLPTREQILSLLGPDSDPELLAAVLPLAPGCGRQALAPLANLLRVRVEAVRGDALRAAVEIGGQEALAVLLSASSDPVATGIETELAICDLLRASAEGVDLAMAAARTASGRALVDALDTPGGSDQTLLPCVEGILGDPRALSDLRARA
ncbi:MAG: zf-HC2 domain-containing protein, partial [Planctomycetota bacterium]